MGTALLTTRNREFLLSPVSPSGNEGTMEREKVAFGHGTQVIDGDLKWRVPFKRQRDQVVE